MLVRELPERKIKFIKVLVFLLQACSNLLRTNEANTVLGGSPSPILYKPLFSCICYLFYVCSDQTEISRKRYFCYQLVRVWSRERCLVQCQFSYQFDVPVHHVITILVYSQRRRFSQLLVAENDFKISPSKHELVCNNNTFVYVRLGQWQQFVAVAVVYGSASRSSLWQWQQFTAVAVVCGSGSSLWQWQQSLEVPVALLCGSSLWQ